MMAIKRYMSSNDNKSICEQRSKKQEEIIIAIA